MIDPNKRPQSLRILSTLADVGELRLWPAQLENVVNAIPTHPTPFAHQIDGVGMRTIQALEHFGLIALRHVPVIEITAEGRALLNVDPERSLDDVAAELSQLLATAPVGRFSMVECSQCHAMVKVPSEIPGLVWECADCASGEPR